MDEKHKNEQYFFDEVIIIKSATFTENFVEPCSLCMPSVSKELEHRGKYVKTLDIDTRFSFLEGFKFFDVKNLAIFEKSLISYYAIPLF